LSSLFYFAGITAPHVHQPVQVESFSAEVTSVKFAVLVRNSWSVFSTFIITLWLLAESDVMLFVLQITVALCVVHGTSSLCDVADSIWCQGQRHRH